MIYLEWLIPASLVEGVRRKSINIFQVPQLQRMQ